MTAENIYGHNKKLMFILNAIKSYSEIHKKSLTEIMVLDFGCGNAVAVSSKIAELGVNLTGIDFHEVSIKFAIKNNKFKTAEFILGNEDIASGLNQKYDIIVYSDIVEHLPDPQSTLKKISKIHNNNGIIIISIPNGFGPFEIEKFITKWTGLQFLVKQGSLLISRIKRKLIKNSATNKKNSIPYNSKSTHCKFFTLKSFTNMLDKSGYSIFKVNHGSFLGASISNIFLGFNRFINWNVKIADRMPYYIVSTWYFVCEKKKK